MNSWRAMAEPGDGCDRCDESENNLRHIVVVSDATHLFRIRELCKDAGLDVYTSPRPVIGHISNYDLAMRYFHEIVSYTAMRLSLNVGWLHSWLEGKPDL